MKTVQFAADSADTEQGAIGDAVDGCYAAFQMWRQLAAKERAMYVASFRRVIARDQDSISSAISEDTGKPLTEAAIQEVTASLEMLRFSERKYPRWLRPYRFKYRRPGFWRHSNAVHFEPLGVVCVIGPSNFPFSIPVMQAGAALLCGNGVVVKPSDRCPRVSDALKTLVKESSLPMGILQIIDGGPSTVEAIIAHPEVRKLYFTGSLSSGKRIASLCAEQVKPSVLELGGSGAAIVCGDADLDVAARAIVWSAFYSGGQSCIGTKRVYVHESVAENLVRCLREVMANLRIGNRHESSTDFSRSRHVPDRENLLSVLREAENEEAVLFGPDGMRVMSTDADPALPLLVSCTPLRSALLGGEVNAPILAVRTVRSDSQAIAEANASQFGLSASIWTRSGSSGSRIARDLDAGIVWVNGVSAGQPEFPWGGRKSSGWGRLFSQFGIQELTNVKVISRDQASGRSAKFWWFPYSAEKLEAVRLANRLLFDSAGLRELWRLSRRMIRIARFSRRGGG